ncbi:sigma-54-dependent transcriptional regulator [Hoeflea marina]|nr:sigma-54 dependent transcriptional regulator [Hoeflea marina]
MSVTSRILIVDDDPVQRRLLKAAVERAGYVAVLAFDGAAALELLSDTAQPVEAVVLDLMMPGMDGIEVMAAMTAAGLRQPVVVQTGQGGIDTVVRAMRAGAFDFVVKPVSPERLAHALAIALRSTQAEPVRPGVAKEGFGTIIAASPAMERVLQLARRAANSDIPVVLEGESGVGKEMIARAIQSESNRRSKAFVTVNCGAIPANLVESILFGHEKGAFTGAAEKHQGKFVEADRGTLFLDEIGDLPADIQVKLLRAVQLGEIETVGARLPRKVDIRLISATNKDLIEEVKAERFREDLYYRLNVFPIHVPALRRRKEDIPQLVRHFAMRFSEMTGRTGSVGVSAETLAMLTGYDWPGNIRELENAIHRAVVLCDTGMLTPDLFPQIAAQRPGYDLRLDPAVAESFAKLASFAQAEDVPGGSPADISSPVGGARDVVSIEPERPGSGHDGPDLGQAVLATSPDGEVRALAEVEEELIRFALAFYNGQMSEVARRLGIGRSTLYRKLKDYSIDPENPVRTAA